MSAISTDLVRTVLLRARDLALTEDTDQRAIRPGHLLLALLEDPDSKTTRELGVHCDVAKLRHLLGKSLTGTRESSWWEAPDIPYSAETTLALALAEQEVTSHGETRLGPTHLIHGLFSLELSQWVDDSTLLAAQHAGIDLRELRSKVLATR